MAVNLLRQTRELSEVPAATLLIADGGEHVDAGCALVQRVVPAADVGLWVVEEGAPVAVHVRLPVQRAGEDVRV